MLASHVSILVLMDAHLEFLLTGPTCLSRLTYNPCFNEFLSNLYHNGQSIQLVHPCSIPVLMDAPLEFLLSCLTGLSLVNLVGFRSLF
jgi:hypothetical protein